MTQILLVEDDETLAELINEYLSEHGYDVTVRADAKAALDTAYERNFDILILDVKLPKGDGFSLLRELRRFGDDTPAIFTTSLNTLQDLEIGYKSGCDDYLKKPYELKELLLRIQILLKRKFSHVNDEFIELNGGYKFYPSSKTLRQNGQIVNLSNKESELLALFLENKNALLSKEAIFEKIWNYGEEPSELSLRVYVKNLRRILGKDAIINRRGDGYIYV
ncbi:two-component system response regulator [Campylobacter showae]|uniref:Response regulator receiver domain protein n=1 Tax=Campylobacter showae RM3277 TaxID=553219 RepID=C6RFG0_9BACT|nr:response regulator transcription factor [Campylobacter showae]EET79968.1 response regulator receiver domain protein [Campylobacter showae RM3277]QCD48833.1 two-component system response regulator [Campylobacter showae]